MSLYIFTGFVCTALSVCAVAAVFTIRRIEKTLEQQSQAGLLPPDTLRRIPDLIREFKQDLLAAVLSFWLAAGAYRLEPVAPRALCLIVQIAAAVVAAICLLDVGCATLNIFRARALVLRHTPVSRREA
ncbi:MAG: hypothetical protein AB1700_04160 [Bacillota bacterium]|jgi:hypothetical protein